MQDFALSAFHQLWSFLAVGLAINYFGFVSKALAKAKGWHHADGFYDVTLRAHPLIAGFVIGLIAPFPTLNTIDAMTGAQLVVTRGGWFMLAGALHGQMYELVKFGVQWIKRRFGGGATVKDDDAEPASDDDAAEAADDEEDAA